MSDEFYAELEARTAEQMAALQATVEKVEKDGLGDDSYLQRLSEAHFQRLLARGLAETYLLLGIAHQRGILDPSDMILPEPVVKARLNAEEDSFAAALEAMDRLGQPEETEINHDEARTAGRENGQPRAAVRDEA